MIIKTILSAGVAAVLLAGLAGTAEAKKGHSPYVEFEDFPFGEHCMRIGHHRHCSIPTYSQRLSCDEARFRLKMKGYKNILTRDCSGNSYSFSAKKNGKRRLLTMNAITGRLN